MERCLELLRGYRIGLNLSQILYNYWKRHQIVSKVVKCLGAASVTGRGVTQGNPEPPMIFNIVVYAVVRAVLEEVCSLQEAQNGMGWAVGERNLVFYADGRRIGGRYHEWVQDALTVMIDIFQRMGMEMNLGKTKAMVCIPMFIWGKWGELAYKRRKIGEKETFME